MKFSIVLVLFALCFSACKSTDPDVEVHDITVCGDKGEFGARCSHTLTSTVEVLTKAQWDARRPGMLCMSSDDFTLDQTTQEQLCTDYGMCDYEAQQAMMAAIKSIHATKVEAVQAKTYIDYYKTHPKKGAQ